MASYNEPEYDLTREEEVALWMLISQVRKELLMVSDKQLRRFDISSVQLGILYALYRAYEEGKSPTINDLSRWVIRRHNTVSVILSGMEKRGLVQVQRNTERKRSTRINLTEKGLNLYHELYNKKKVNATARILGSLSPKERQQLTTLLEKLDEKARSILLKMSFP